MLQLGRLDGEYGLAQGAKHLIGQGQRQHNGAGAGACRDGGVFVDVCVHALFLLFDRQGLGSVVQLRRIDAIADPYAMQPQSIMEEQESRRELYDGLKRLAQREQTYLLYRYGFTDGEEHPLIGTAIYFHLTKSRAKKTEEQAMDNLWLELPWWFI